MATPAVLPFWLWANEAKEASNLKGKHIPLSSAAAEEHPKNLRMRLRGQHWWLVGTGLCFWRDIKEAERYILVKGLGTFTCMELNNLQICTLNMKRTSKNPLKRQRLESNVSISTTGANTVSSHSPMYNVWIHLKWCVLVAWHVSTRL